MCNVEASFDDAAARYTKLKLCDLVMERTNARKYMYGSISALNAFTGQRKFQGKWQPKLEGFDVALGRRFPRTPPLTPNARVDAELQASALWLAYRPEHQEKTGGKEIPGGGA
jgi:hypothetical protein